MGGRVRECRTNPCAAEEQVQKAAEETTVDFSGLSAEPTEDGGVSFNVNSAKKLPDGAKYTAKIIYVPDHSSMILHTKTKKKKKHTPKPNLRCF